MNDRIEELLEQLKEEVFTVYSTGTSASLRIEPGGYMHISVEQVEKNNDFPTEAWKRRELCDSWKTVNGEWKDRSSEQNDYYRARKLLLEV